MRLSINYLLYKMSFKYILLKKLNVSRFSDKKVKLSHYKFERNKQEKLCEDKLTDILKNNKLVSNHLPLNAFSLANILHILYLKKIIFRSLK